MGYSLVSTPEVFYSFSETMADVHVRICEQEIIKYDLEIKALIQV